MAITDTPPKNIDASLIEIDEQIKNILLEMILIADTRTLSNKTSRPLWDSDRIIQVDELDTEDIFNAYLVSNKKKEIDVSLPIMAYCEADGTISDVFYGSHGSRMRQWEFMTQSNASSWVVGDPVWIIKGALVGTQGVVADVSQYPTIKVNVEGFGNMDFQIDELRQTGDKAPFTFKAKQIILDYDVVILTELRREAQYIRDKFILRCTDHHWWHPFKSRTINDSYNYIFTVFDTPNIKKYSRAEDQLKGLGYVYGTSFRIHVWSALTDGPLPVGFIEQIRMNLHVETEDHVNRIVVG